MNSSNNKEIVAVEIIKAINGKANELRNALRDIVPICRKRKGCLQYELLEPIAGSGEFLVLMRFKDPKILKNHENSQLIQEFVRKYDGILYGEVIQTEWHPVG